MRTTHAITGVVLFTALALAVTVVAHDTPQSRARAEMRVSIDNCWDEQGRRSLHTWVARHLAAVCERMEAELKKMP